MVLRQAAAAVNALDDQTRGLLVEQLRLVGTILGIPRLEELRRRRQRLDAGLEQLRVRDEVDGLVAELRPQGRGPALHRLEVTLEVEPAPLGELLLLARSIHHLELLELVGEQELLELALALDVDLARAVLHLVERRLGDVDEAPLDQLLHLPVEEGEHERADVGAVDVGVGHQHDLVVAEVVDLELVRNPGADRRDQRLDLVVGENLVDPALLDVDDLAAQRQHRLRVPVAPLLRRAARRVALDDEQLRKRAGP